MPLNCAGKPLKIFAYCVNVASRDFCLQATCRLSKMHPAAVAGHRARNRRC